MAEISTTLKLKIVDLEEFRRIVGAIGAWAEEVSRRSDLTPAETELFDAAVDLKNAAKG